MDIHAQPINERIEWLFDFASRYSYEFSSPEACLARENYRAEHPTSIIVLKCMDGRINIPFATNMPPGIIQPYRNLGGTFDLGWPYFGEVLAQHVSRMLSVGRRVLILVTYHFSRGDTQRGCAGFNYDTGAAIRQSYEIKRKAEQVFGTEHGTVYPIVCGFETDEDALILHGENGAELDLSTLMPEGEASLAQQVATMLPGMSEQVRNDLLPLLHGNLSRIAEVRGKTRLLEIQHREWMICVGRGFDFLHIPNVALIIGPYSPDLADPIRKGAGIIEANMNAGRIPDDGFLLLASAPYLEVGMDLERAELKSRFLATFASDVINREFPELAENMFTHNTVLNWRSRKLETIEPD